MSRPTAHDLRPVRAPSTTYWVVASVPYIAGEEFNIVAIAAFHWNYTDDTTETGDLGWRLGDGHAELAGRLFSSAEWRADGGALQMSVSVTAIPEPSSVVLFDLAVLTGGAVLVRRPRLLPPRLRAAIVQSMQRVCAVDLGAADVCGGWLAPPPRPCRIESPSNSSTRDTGQQPTIR
jgi:hypothetical protein